MGEHVNGVASSGSFSASLGLLLASCSVVAPHASGMLPSARQSSTRSPERGVARIKISSAAVGVPGQFLCRGEPK